MDGIHDLGGKPGYGRVDRTGENEVFHDRWEALVFAMARAGAMADAWRNVDRFRHAIERIDPTAYLEHGYYGRWLGGIETLLIEAGIVTREEITAKARDLGAKAGDLIAARPNPDPDAKGPKPSASGCARHIDREPLFRVGDEVVTSPESQAGHTRLPAYARGKKGRVELFHGGWVYPDSNAHGLGEDPQYLYTVRFDSETLWMSSGFSVTLDLFEPYLHAVEN